MIAVDTNILVYSHRRDMPFHASAKDLMQKLVESSDRWAIPWPCIHEFLSIVTNPKIFIAPTPVEHALAQIQAWIASSDLQLLAEDEGYLEILVAFIANAKVVGAKIHDARVAALCIYHGVKELWTADRDFSRFRQLSTKNPLVT